MSPVTPEVNLNLPVRRASVAQVAAAAGMSNQAIRERIRRGVLTLYRVGPKKSFLDLDQVEAVLGAVK